jgi:hypothetical protein
VHDLVFHGLASGERDAMFAKGAKFRKVKRMLAAMRPISRRGTRSR